MLARDGRLLRLLKEWKPRKYIFGLYVCQVVFGVDRAPVVFGADRAPGSSSPGNKENKQKPRVTVYSERGALRASVT